MSPLTLIIGIYLLIMIPVIIFLYANMPARERKRINNPEMNHLLHDICSRYPEKVWSAACEIVRSGQSPEKIKLLTPYLSMIEEKTSWLKMGGSISPNQIFVDFAILTIRFHRDSSRCPCALYTSEYQFRTGKTKYYYFEPMDMFIQGYIDILHLTHISNGHVDHIVKCRKCGQKFKVEERQYHAMWWSWDITTDEERTAIIV